MQRCEHAAQTDTSCLSIVVLSDVSPIGSLGGYTLNSILSSAHRADLPSPHLVALVGGQCATH